MHHFQKYKYTSSQVHMEYVRSIDCQLPTANCKLITSPSGATLPLPSVNPFQPIKPLFMAVEKPVMHLLSFACIFVNDQNAICIFTSS